MADQGFLQNFYPYPFFSAGATGFESQDSGGLFFYTGLLYPILREKLHINNF